MPTITTTGYGSAKETQTYKKTKKVNGALSPNQAEKTQRQEFKEGLKEAILISKGEINGIPLSELWDE